MRPGVRFLMPWLVQPELTSFFVSKWLPRPVVGWAVYEGHH